MAYLCPTAPGDLAGKMWWLEMALWLGPIWRLLHSHMWGLDQDILRAGMANGSLASLWSLASSQHGDLEMVDLVLQQFRAPSVHFFKETRQSAFPLVNQSWWPHSVLPPYSSAPSSHEPDETPGEKKIECQVCNLQGRRTCWRPMEELPLQPWSKGSLESNSSFFGGPQSFFSDLQLPWLV